MTKICAACGYKSGRKAPTWCVCGLVNAWVDEETTSTALESPSALVRADSIAVTPTERVVTGTAFDLPLGGGVPLGGALLIWGKSGSGKTRLTLQMARKMSPVVVVSLEMTEEETTKILTSFDIDTSQVWITREQNWRPLALRVRPRLVIVDSLSVWGYGATDEMRLCYNWSHEHGITVAAICHATSNGKAKGGTGPTHWSDAALIVRGKGNGRATVDTPSKNRFGPTGPGRPVGRGSIAR